MSHKSHSNAGQADMSYIARHEHQRHQDSSLPIVEQLL
jgi:hypothetical protein